MATLTFNCNMSYVRTVHVSGISYRIYADCCRRVAIRKDLVLRTTGIVLGHQSGKEFGAKNATTTSRVFVR